MTFLFVVIFEVVQIEKLLKHIGVLPVSRDAVQAELARVQALLAVAEAEIIALNRDKQLLLTALQRLRNDCAF